MKTHKEILGQWIGRNIDYDGMFGFQCVDWVRKYCLDRGYPIKSFGGSAWNGWKTGCPFDSSWQKIIKTESNYPSEGDIVFWDEGRCPNGHVAVAGRHCNGLLRCSDQNGTGHQNKVSYRWYTNKNVVGWFHKQ